MLKKTLVIVLACVAMGFAMVKVAWTAETNSSKKLICTVDFSSWIAESLTASPDYTRVAYVARRGKKNVVVIDGKEEKQSYDAVAYFVFSPDSKRVAYLAKTGSKVFVVVDGKEEKPYDDILGGSTIKFNSDGSLYYLASKGNGIYLVTQELTKADSESKAIPDESKSEETK